MQGVYKMLHILSLYSKNHERCGRGLNDIQAGNGDDRLVYFCVNR